MPKVHGHDHPRHSSEAHASQGERRDHGDEHGVVTAVLEMAGVGWASEKLVVESTLRRLPGVRSVDANPVSQTVTVVYDPAVTRVAELRQWVEDCGYHCAGQSVPHHLCSPTDEPAPPPRREEAHPGHGEHAERETEETPPSPHAVMGHGGHGAMSMAEIVAPRILPPSKYWLRYSVCQMCSIRRGSMPTRKRA